MIVLAVVPLVALGLFWWWSVDHLLRDRRHAKVIVELRSGETFQAVLARCDGRTLSLTSVSLVTADGDKPVDGELLVPRSDVKFVQRP